MAEETKTPTQEKAKIIADLLKAEDLSESDGELDPTILDTAGLELPDSYQLESMAAELVEHLSAYHRNKAALKAARAQGDGVNAEKLFRGMSYSRLVAAYLQSQFPGIKPLADEIAQAKAIQIKQSRAALLGAEKD